MAVTSIGFINEYVAILHPTRGPFSPIDDETISSPFTPLHNPREDRNG
jgi:hypothetical protein